MAASILLLLPLQMIILQLTDLIVYIPAISCNQLGKSYFVSWQSAHKLIYLSRVRTSSTKWTERLVAEAATRLIPTLAKVTGRVCISGNRKTMEIKKSGLNNQNPPNSMRTRDPLYVICMFETRRKLYSVMEHGGC